MGRRSVHLRMQGWAVESVILLAGAATLALLFVAMGRAPMTHAQQPSDGTCRAAMVIDRSGSVGEDPNLITIRAQIRRLFQPGGGVTGGLYNDKIKLAFWSFSDTTDIPFWLPTPPPNYDQPFNTYVSSKGEDSSFNTNLSRVQSSGGTNYEQGFGYSQGAINTYDNIDQITNNAQIIVFMTDGLPNEPGGPSNAIRVAREAVLKRRALNQVIVGGVVGNIPVDDLAEVINGQRSNHSDIFHISGDYSDLSRQLKKYIGESCDPFIKKCPYDPALLPDDPRCLPPAASPYSLAPSVTASGQVISGTDSAGFAYKVTNDSTSATSDSTRWSVKRLVVDRNQSIDKLNFAPDTYKDNYSCDVLKDLLDGHTTCDDTGVGGVRTFAPGVTVISAAELGSVNSATVDDSWQVGTKLCYVLAIDKPTRNDAPKDRYSQASCVIVGKRPTIHVLGGDVTVGRYFTDDDLKDGKLPSIKGSITTKAGAIGKTFGSWGEYGAFAPGTIDAFASASGLKDGYGGSVGSRPDLWNRLTFANKQGDYGHFTSARGLGRVTDMASYFLRGRTVTKDLTADSTISFNGPSLPVGLYQKPTNDLAIDTSVLEKGKMVIVNVPNGTVTIKGNLSYAGGKYQSVEQIPQLIIIAKAIVINSNVSNVDAWLIAQAGDGSGGVITTCDVPGNLTSEICNQALQINGPVEAKQLVLRRTGGSGTGGASGDAAEVINLRADAYLWAFREGRSAVRAQTTHTIELPPQF